MEREAKQTLVFLTHDFIRLLKARDGVEVELSAAEKELGANKRRLYDVTNVLAGVGLIERHGKSKVKWVGRTPPGQEVDSHELWVAREAELRRLIDLAAKYLGELSASPEYDAGAWVSQEDIRRLDPEGGLNLFALKGPPTMTIQVDIHDEEHHMICKAEEGRIDLIPIRRESEIG